MPYESRNIPLDAINFSDTWNLHPWELYSIRNDLCISFSDVGILHPPIVRARDTHSFEVVCGFKRSLFASSSAQTNQINCLILTEDTQPASILDIILTDQSISRPLSLAEKARFLEISCRFLHHQEIIDIFFKRLQLDQRHSTLLKLLEILKQHPLLIAEIHNGALQNKIVMELLGLREEADRIAMVKLFKNLSMGDGKQRKFFPLIRDLASRFETSIAAYLEKPSIQNILHHPEMNIPQKVQHLALFLFSQTNPMSAQAENEFTRKINSLQIPQNCTITHSPSFEKDEVTLSILFKDVVSCEHWLPTLKHSLTS